MLLVVETITWKPHVETAMEIAFLRRGAGERVVYCNLRRGLPACEDASAAHFLVNLPETRVRRAGTLLRKSGIEVQRPVHPRDQRRRANRLARDMLEGCRSIEDVRSLAHEGMHDLGWGALSSLITLTRRTDVSLVKDRGTLAALCAASILVYDRTRALIQEHSPDQVLLFNGRFATTRAVMRAAESLGVPWLIHERGGSKDRYWAVDYIPHDIDRLQQDMLAHWKEENAPHGHAFFQARRDRVEHGWHSLTKDQQRGRLPAFFGDGAGWVTFFTSSEDEMASIGDRFRSPAFPTQESAIRAVAAAVARIPGLRLCVRVHPHVSHKSREDQRFWEEFSLPGVEVIAASDPVDSYALIDSSRVVCSYGSSVGIEATYWGRPSLLLSRAYYDRLNVAEPASNEAAIERFLREPRTFPREATLPCGAFFYTLGEKFRYYDADGLHRGSIRGVYLDDSPAVRAAKWAMRVAGRLRRKKRP